jgi:hypothetical protein
MCSFVILFSFFDKNNTLIINDLQSNQGVSMRAKIEWPPKLGQVF